jgi:NAD-dependent dihydropyrimidine dehydrogenase PreA subunit
MSFLSRFLGAWPHGDRNSAVDHGLAALPDDALQKRIPVIDVGYCTGCGKCIEACPSEALELVWDFARLKYPARCTSEADCVEVCPTGIIEMQWSTVEGARTAGHWRDVPGSQV